MFKLEEKKVSNKVPLIAMGAIVGTAGLYGMYKMKKNYYCCGKLSGEPYVNRRKGKFYFVGGGIASLAGAAYLIRDCHVKGENIYIFEGLNVIGDSNYSFGNPAKGFLCTDIRMFNKETYENFWELFSDIPSLNMPGWSVTEEIFNFDYLHPTRAQARLINEAGDIADSNSMGFSIKDRLALGELMNTPEEILDDLTIEDWFADTPHFFKTNFWIMWQTTFAFQKWSSLFEFKRCMERMIIEFSRLDTLEGVTCTPYNQYESVIVPLKEYLRNSGVNFKLNTRVTDIDFKEGLGITATAIHIKDEKGQDGIIMLKEGDGCFMTNGCITDNSSLGDFNTAPKYESKQPISAELWRRVTAKKPGIGNPNPFFNHPEKTNWESFTVTCKGNLLLKIIEKFSGNTPGSGGLITFKDSNWLLSIVIPPQPYFKNQPMDETVFWGYGLHTGKMGNYIKKFMKECTGEEILREVLHHLHLNDREEEILNTIVNVIPCMMPYIAAPFQPHKISDRPQVVPEGSTNFAIIGEFVEMPEDRVFTDEYSVRSARMAVYKLLKVKNKKVSKVNQYKNNPRVILKAVKTTFK